MRKELETMPILATLMIFIMATSVSTILVKADDHSVTKDWVMSNLNNPNVVLLDARSFAEYQNGHLPRAINIEWTYCYDYNSTRKPNDELEKIFQTAGVIPQKTVVTYCQAGSRAEAEYNVLCTLGYPRVYVYPGSWAEWSADPHSPVETRITLALVGGEKNNTGEGCSCSSNGLSSRTYTFVSGLYGIDRILAIGSALANSKIRELVANFTLEGFVPVLAKANATRVTYENGEGGFEQGTMVIIPCKIVGQRNENVTLAEILFVSEPVIAGAGSEEVVNGKTWLTSYYVNETTGKVEGVMVDPCDYWCLIGCALQQPEIWAYCTAFCICALTFPPCVVPCVLCIIGLGAISTICTFPCGCWTPPTVTIKIEAWPTTDYYSRSHGMAIDQPLPNDWWLHQGYEFKVTASYFTYQTTVTINSPGTHYVEYAASGYVPNYAWHAKIYINGAITAEGDVGRFNHLRAYFNV